MNIGINIAYINKQLNLLIIEIRQPNVYTTQYNSVEQIQVINDLMWYNMGITCTLGFW